MNWLARSTRCVAQTAACAVLVATAPAQSEQWRNIGQARGDQLGAAVAWLGDVDGDGLPDFVARARPLAADQPYRYLVTSGASGATLLELAGDDPGAYFFGRAAALGDIDADGVADLAIGASNPGRFQLCSGKGPVIRTVVAGADEDRLSGHFAALDDLDADGILDFAYDAQSLRTLDYGVELHHFVNVVSGADGALLWRYEWIFQPDPWSGGGAGEIAGLGDLGDLDGDGLDEFWVWVRGFGGSGSWSFVWGQLDVFSGSDGAFRFSIDVGDLTATALVGDLDDDGVADLATSGVRDIAGSPEDDPFAVVASGADGSTLLDLADLHAWWFVGGSDLDGDGLAELLVPRDHDVVARSITSGLDLAVYDTGLTPVAALDASLDVDGDGLMDLLVGLPSEGPSAALGAAGAVRALAAVDGALLVESTGVAFQSSYGDGVSAVADRDDDGWLDVAIAVPGELDGSISFIQIVSGSDGNELARITPEGGIAGEGALIGVGDVDGDAIDDLALARQDGAVEVRSGRDDSVVMEIMLPVGTPTRLAAADDLDGHVLLAVATSAEEVQLYDLSAGDAPMTISGRGATGVDCVGDIDGDGVVDWTVCDPDKQSGHATIGMVSVVSGADGATIWSGNGTATNRLLDVHRVDDLSGDGLDDVLVYSNGTPTGLLTARSGRRGGKLFELAGPATGVFWGTIVASVGDVNGDGDGDFAIGDPFRGTVELWSGATAVLLRRIGDVGGAVAGARFAARRRGFAPRLGPGADADLLIGSPAFDVAVPGRGSVQMIRWRDLFLEIAPSTAKQGDTVTADTRGGPAGAAAGLYLVSIDDVRIDEFGAFATLDGLGSWTTSDVVPPGLAGSVFVLRSYCVGFDGRLASSTCESVVFE